MTYFKYIDELYRRQNYKADVTQKNLAEYEFYEKLVLDIDKILRENPDASLDELRNLVIKKSGIIDKIRDFCLLKKCTPGMVIGVDTKFYHHEFYAGNKQEVFVTDNGLIKDVEPIVHDTIFDLASITKLFTGITVLKLVELGLINLSDEVSKYVPQFINLKGVTIFDLLSFKLLGTNKRVDAASSREEAESILFTTEPQDRKFGTSAYNDFSSMVLKYVIEKVSGMDYYTFLKINILDPLEMHDTLVKIGNDKINRVASCNADIRYYKDGKIMERDYIQKGISSDDKARVLGQSEGNLSGHAGLFSTAKDMARLANALIYNMVISAHLRDEMAKNRSGYIYKKEDGTQFATQYLGMLCYAKNPYSSITEVYHPLSGNSFAAAGWSGTQFTVDPLNEISIFLGSNRAHNRLTVNGHPEKTFTNANGERKILLPDGREVIDSSHFAYDRDEAIIHPALILALKLKILEDIVGINDLEKVNKKTLIR